MNELTNQDKDWILSLKTEHKIMLLKSALKQNDFGNFMALSNILLEAPCGEGGGLPTETIDAIFKNSHINRILNQHKNK